VNKRREQIKFLIFVVIFILGIVGCSVLLRSGDGGPAGGGGETQAGEGGELTTMTFQQFDSITNNATRQEIEEKYGTPVPREQVIAVGVVPDDPSTENCIYYKADPPTFGEWFEFCFEGDQLANKTSL
jgi:hypothetical protein